MIAPGLVDLLVSVGNIGLAPSDFAPGSAPFYQLSAKAFQMATIALINIDMHGHVNPTLGLTAELCRRGHQVYFFSTEEFRNTVTPTGARFEVYPSHIGKATAESAKEQALATMAGKAPPKQASALGRALTEFDQTFAPLQRRLSALKPDVIVYDFVSLAAKIIADNLGIPAIKFFTTYASNEHYNLLSESFAKHDYPTLAELQAAQSLLDTHCQRVGFKAPNLVLEMQKIDDRNLVFLPQALQPKGETFDERFDFVGPCFQPATSAAVEELIPAGDGPVMLVSLGSLFHEWPEFYRSCIEAFGNTAWRVVMSIGSRLERKDLGLIPRNFRVESHIPQVALLPLASVFITHGGMNSTMEAQYYGVPLVVIPQIEEQGITARQVAQMALGIHIERPLVDTQALRDAVDRVHNEPLFRNRVAGMREQIEAAGGPARAASIIERMLTGPALASVNNLGVQPAKY